MDQTNDKPRWEDVPRAEIERELTRIRRQYPKQESVYMVTCRYGDGSPTCSACVEFPYSDISRKLFTLQWGPS